MMAFCRGVLLLLALLLINSAALAQPKPYSQLAVSYDRLEGGEAALNATLETLRKAVAEKDLATIDRALAPGYVALECEGDPTKPCTPAERAHVRSNPKLKPPLRIRQALCCRDLAPARISKALREETVLGLIGSALEEESIGAHTALPGLACLPAWPKFDPVKAAAIATAADIDRENLRVTTSELVMLEKPVKGAAEIGRIPAGQIAPFVTDLPESLPDGWTAIALPQGALGYTQMLGLADLTPGGICLAKNPAGIWEIMLTIQRRS